MCSETMQQCLHRVFNWIIFVRSSCDIASSFPQCTMPCPPIECIRIRISVRLKHYPMHNCTCLGAMACTGQQKETPFGKKEVNTTAITLTWWINFLLCTYSNANEDNFCCCKSTLTRIVIGQFFILFVSFLR